MRDQATPPLSQSSRSRPYHRMPPRPNRRTRIKDRSNPKDRRQIMSRLRTTSWRIYLRLKAIDHKDPDGAWDRWTSCFNRLVEFVASVPDSERHSSGLETWVHKRVTLWRNVVRRDRDRKKSRPRVLAMLRHYMVAGEQLFRSAPNQRILRQCRRIRRDLDDKLREANWGSPESSEGQTVGGESGEKEEPGAME
jgi:hypothetical protein